MRGRNLVAMSAILGLVSGCSGSMLASAAVTTNVIQGQVLRLESVADWDAASTLTPGEPVQWTVAVSANAPDPAKVRIFLSAAGDAPLTVDVALCPREWDADGCSDGATPVKTAWDVPRDGVFTPLTTISTSEVAHLRLSIALASASSASTDITVLAQTAQESVEVSPDGGLAMTGISQSTPWVIGSAAVLLASFGAMLLGSARRRREPDPK